MDQDPSQCVHEMENDGRSRRHGRHERDNGRIANHQDQHRVGRPGRCELFCPVKRRLVHEPEEVDVSQSNGVSSEVFVEQIVLREGLSLLLRLRDGFEGLGLGELLI